MDNLQIFNYREIPVRTLLLDGEPWWVLGDVCRVLDLGSPHKVADRLDPDEKGRNTIPTPGGNQNMAVINEPGLYKVILQSRKPEAREFSRWGDTRGSSRYSQDWTLWRSRAGRGNHRGPGQS